MEEIASKSTYVEFQLNGAYNVTYSGRYTGLRKCGPTDRLRFMITGERGYILFPGRLSASPDSPIV